MEMGVKMIFAIDFDGTLCENEYPLIGNPRLPIINKCKELKQFGHKLVLNTCREDNLLADAVEWCKNFGLFFDSINNNLPDRINQFKTDCRKIGADYYVDDKNMSLDDFVKFSNTTKIVCPICGREMDESYLGEQYCYDCKKEILGGLFND